MKVLKIFLRLKWQETIGAIQWGLSAIIFSIAIASAAAFVGVLYLLGRICELIHIGNGKTIDTGLGAFMMLCLLALAIYLLKKFCLWIRSNWREAKRLAGQGDK
jgi:hypothetical protein